MPETRPAAVDDVDPDIREFQRITSRDYAGLSAGADESPATRRHIAEKVREPWRAGGPAMADISETTIPSGVAIRIYTPSDAEPERALIYMHGGGWVMFSLDTHDRLMREYAARSRTVVIGVDYRLSPEAPYPSALNDVSSVLEWAAGGGLGSGYDHPKIILGGDSAGANLAIAATMRARDESKRGADGLLLNYGAYDCQERASHLRYDGDDYMLTRDEMAGFWNAYLGDAKMDCCDYARPLHVAVKGLPPAFMCIAECDILLDENREMAARLREAGVCVTEKIYSGATHSFLEAVSISALAQTALNDASAWLKQIA